jgi:hypothetical protein
VEAVLLRLAVLAPLERLEPAVQSSENASAEGELRLPLGWEWRQALR